MKDYSVLEGLDRNFIIELRCAYDRGYRHGRDDEWAKTQVKLNEDDGYKRGLEEAWACAKRIIKLSPDMQEDIFNMRGDHFILDAYSADEAIDILKRYDEKNDEIKVGDEVVDSLGFKSVVVTDKPTEKGDISLLSNSFQTTQLFPVKELKKTGRHYPQIAEVLEQIRGGADA